MSYGPKQDKSDGTTRNGLSDNQRLDSAIVNAIRSDPSAGDPRIGAVALRAAAGTDIQARIAEIGDRIEALDADPDSPVATHGEQVRLMEDDG